MANNRLGLEILKFLRDAGESLVALAIHPPETARFREELVEWSGLEQDALFDGSQLDEPEVRARLAALAPDIGLSVLFGYILKPGVLRLFPRGCVNLHPGLLPHNRGAHPNVWSIVESTPAGVTLHYIDEGIDTGDIIAQCPVDVQPTDTGKTLYNSLEAAALQLFQETWPALRLGEASRTPQKKDAGSFHRLRDLQTIDEIQLDEEYTARELIDILRARTFPPYKSAFFRHGDRKIHIQLQLTADDQDSSEVTDERNDSD